MDSGFDGFEDLTLRNLNFWKDQLKHLKQRQAERTRGFKKRIDETYRNAYGNRIDMEDGSSLYNRKLNEDLISRLGKSRRVKHEIKTGTHPPVFTPPRRTVRAAQHIIQQNVKEMILHKIIRPSVSPYSSPVILVPKKSGKKRFCIGYRKLNSITEKNKYPPPIYISSIIHLYILYSMVPIYILCLFSFYLPSMCRKNYKIVEETTRTFSRSNYFAY